jgi:hypothetical protein
MILRSIFSLQQRPENVTTKFNKILHQKEKLLGEAFEKVKGVSFKKFDLNRISLENQLQDMYQKNGILLFVYENDSLVYWSTNSVSCQEVLSSKLHPDTSYFEKRKNGWYEVIRKNIFSKTSTLRMILKRGFLFLKEQILS